MTDKKSDMIGLFCSLDSVCGSTGVSLMEFLGAVCRIYDWMHEHGDGMPITAMTSSLSIRRKKLLKITNHLQSIGWLFVANDKMHLVENPLFLPPVDPRNPNWFLVYKITHKKTGRFYIGKSNKKSWDKGYMGGGTLIRDAMAREGVENFKREIVFAFNLEQSALNKEAELISQDPPPFYNIAKPAPKYNHMAEART